MQPSSSIQSVSVYPNPANDKATILFNADKPTKYLLIITDALGKQLQQINGQSVTGLNKVINVHGYAQGAYFIKLIDEENGANIIKLNKQ